MQHKHAMLVADRITKAFMDHLDIVDHAKNNPSLLAFLTCQDKQQPMTDGAIQNTVERQQKEVELFIWNREFSNKINPLVIGQKQFKQIQKIITSNNELIDKVKAIWSIVFETPTP